MGATYGDATYGDSTYGGAVVVRSSIPAFSGPREIRLETWRYFLALSSNMEILGELDKAVARTLTVDNNKSGGASFTHPMDDKKLAPYIKSWRTCVIAQRGYQDSAEWFWSGPVSSVTKDFAAGTIQVDAIGWFELLMRRLILTKVTYSAQDAATIAFALLALANSQRDTHISAGISEVSQSRTRTYEIDTVIGQEIQNLAELESGYDWYIDPRTRELNIVTRRGVDHPEVKWLFIADESDVDPQKKAARGNLQNVVEGEDGSTLINDLYARGKFSSGHADSPASQELYDVLFQEAASLSDVADSDILNAFANAEIVYRQNPRLTYTITPKPHTVPGVPLLFDDYDIGDTTYLTARRGEFEISDQAIRIFGFSMSIDDLGVENITNLKTAADQ